MPVELGFCVRLLTLARDLRRRKSRERQSLFVAEGVRSVEELLSSSVNILGVLTAPQLKDAPRGTELLQLLAERNVIITPVNDAEFRSAAETESPQGILAVAEIPTYSLETLATSTEFRILLLDGLQDPGNVGTILRTAAAFSFDATIALPGTVDIWNAKVVRSAMGSLFRHPAFHDTAENVFTFLAAHEAETWGADTTGHPTGDHAVPDRLALVVGNEGAGLSSYVRNRVDRLVSIDISKSVESLNVAVATGIFLYQLRK